MRNMLLAVHGSLVSNNYLLLKGFLPGPVWYQSPEIFTKG